MPDLLYEIGVEELPASYIEPAFEYLGVALGFELAAAKLTQYPDARFDSFQEALAFVLSRDLAAAGYGDIHAEGTPRRLVVSVVGVAERQPDREEDAVGPPVKAAFDADGKPTQAALGFAKAQGVNVGEIQKRDTGRGMYCCVRKRVEGRPATELLAEILPRITRRIPFPKSMIWPGSDQPFGRPVRSLLALLGRDIVSFELFGLRSGRNTEGHPILSPGAIEIADGRFDPYVERLRGHAVIVDVAERKRMIRKGIGTALASTGGRLGFDSQDAEDALVDEVANLVQYPSVTTGRFKQEFLDIPASIVKAAMTEHQRYFPVDDAGGLRPHFIVVSDRGPEPSDQIRVGNEEVLHARLADAQFFYEQDGKAKLADRVEDLRGGAFLKGLGTYAEKAERLEVLSRHVSDALGLDGDAAGHAARAARLCKADLLTEMVGEFPKLQGEVGRIYALRDGEPEPVAAAIAEHYLPRSADGALPATPAGLALSLTEKADNLVSCFALGLAPTGSADPYALRRQAQAVIRIIRQGGRHFRLPALLRKGLELLPEPHCKAEEAIPNLLEFLRDRTFQMALSRGAPHDLIRAALAAGMDDVLDFRMRLDALLELSTQPLWQPLVIAVERTFNISKDAPEGGSVDPALFTEPLEKELWSLVEAHHDEIERLEDARQYAEASRRYAEVFSETLHQFFEDVFVNVEDDDVRNNRLRLVRRINRLYSDRIADLSQIITGVHT